MIHHLLVETDINHLEEVSGGWGEDGVVTHTFYFTCSSLPFQQHWGHQRPDMNSEVTLYFTVCVAYMNYRPQMHVLNVLYCTKSWWPHWGQTPNSWEEFSPSNCYKSNLLIRTAHHHLLLMMDYLLLCFKPLVRNLWEAINTTASCSLSGWGRGEMFPADVSFRSCSRQTSSGGPKRPPPPNCPRAPHAPPCATIHCMQLKAER